MEKIVWTDAKYSVGNAQIDNQHKYLVKQLNRLIALQKQRGNKTLQKNILGDLEKYVEQHLVYEENLLHKVGYPNVDEHEQLHSQYMMELEMWAVMIDDDDPNILKRMCHFLQTWLTEHIVGEDMKFKKYVS